MSLKKAGVALRAIAFAAGVLVAGSANAIVVSGTFIGTTYERVVDHFSENEFYNTYQSVGYFQFDLSTWVDWEGKPINSSLNGGAYDAGLGSASVLNVGGPSFQWGPIEDRNSYHTVSVRNSGGLQYMSLGLGQSLFHGFNLTLAALPGTFNDPFNFDPSRLILGQTTIDYTGARCHIGTVDVASMNVTAPVPEPGTYALMLAGLGLVGAIARRRKTAD